MRARLRAIVLGAIALAAVIRPPLAGVIAPSDAFVVERLRRSGAVILGKTNLSEWANFRPVRASSGWSAVGGPTKNPHALDRSPSGSSEGALPERPANEEGAQPLQIE